MSIEESQEKGIFGKEVDGRQLFGADALFAATATVAAEAATERNQAVSTWNYSNKIGAILVWDSGGDHSRILRSVTTTQAQFHSFTKGLKWCLLVLTSAAL